MDELLETDGSQPVRTVRIGTGVLSVRWYWWWRRAQPRPKAARDAACEAAAEWLKPVVKLWPVDTNKVLGTPHVEIETTRLKTSCRLMTVVIKSFECGLVARFRLFGSESPRIP